jgi:hypothetical protein
MTFVRQVIFIFCLSSIAYFMYRGGRAVSRSEIAVWVKFGVILVVFAFALAAMWTSLGSFLSALSDATPLETVPAFSQSITKLEQAELCFLVLVVPYVFGVQKEMRLKEK